MLAGFAGNNGNHPVFVFTCVNLEAGRPRPLDRPFHRYPQLSIPALVQLPAIHSSRVDQVMHLHMLPFVFEKAGKDGIGIASHRDETV